MSAPRKADSAAQYALVAGTIGLLAGLSVLTGWVFSAERRGVLGLEPSIALVALPAVLVFAALAWVSAVQLRRMDAERARAQRALSALRDSQELLQGIVESSDDAIISKTLKGIITSWNPGAQRLFGHTAQQAIGQPMLMIIPPERATEEAAILSRIARGERVDHFETVRVRADGTRIDISATISPLKYADGQIRGASKIARDITERKAHERKLQAQLARLRLLEQITRAIGERQDLHSIFRVAIHSLEEHLPIDFGCIALHEVAGQPLEVACVGTRSQALAPELALAEHAQIRSDENGLGRCLRGEFVYEPDISGSPFPLPARLARGGLRALVIAPLSVENKVFGGMIAARREPASFASADCEFLRQLSEHLALAAHQVRLHSALQQAD